MSTPVQIIIAVLFPIFSCACLILGFSKVAKRTGLVDLPDARKQHVGEVPIVGGAAIFFTVMFTGVLTGVGLEALLPVFIGSLLVLVGVIDDKSGLSAYLRLPLQSVTALLMVYVADISIGSIGSIFGGNDLMLSGFAATIFTITCTVGVINSINMIDGVDGLSGVIVSLTLLPLLFFCWLAGDFESLILLVSCLIAIFTFLYFNARFFRNSALVFLGDAGSMFFGFLIVWFLVKLSQGPSAALSPISAGWIFGLPLVDTVSVMVHRICERRSPFDADRHHLHHKFLDAGFSVNHTVSVMGLVHAVFITVGVLSSYFQELEPFFFWMFVGIVLIYFWQSRGLVSLAVKFNRHNVLSANKL